MHLVYGGSTVPQSVGLCEMNERARAFMINSIAGHSIQFNPLIIYSTIKLIPFSDPDWSVAFFYTMSDVCECVNAARNRRNWLEIKMKIDYLNVESETFWVVLHIWFNVFEFWIIDFKKYFEVMVEFLLNHACF